MRGKKRGPRELRQSPGHKSQNGFAPLPQRARPNLPLTPDAHHPLAMTRSGEMPMTNPLPRDEYMRLLYEQAAREQRELAERVRAAYGSGALAADFERWASDLERLAHPIRGRLLRA